MTQFLMITLTIAIPRYSGRIYVLLGLGLDVQETMRNIDTKNVPITKMIRYLAS
jgi:hypothetical protein